MAFRTNTVACSNHNIDESAQTDGLAHQRMKRSGVTAGKPKDRRQANKGPKMALRPSIDESGRITRIVYPKAA